MCWLRCAGSERVWLAGTKDSACAHTAARVETEYNVPITSGSFLDRQIIINARRNDHDIVWLDGD